MGLMGIGRNGESLYSSQDLPAPLVYPCPQHTELPAGQCRDLAPSPLSHYQLPIPGCSHSVLPALGHRECHRRTQIPRTPPENPDSSPAASSPAASHCLMSTKYFHVANYLVRLCCCGQRCRRENPPLPKPTWPSGSRESPGWVSPRLSIPTLTTHPNSPRPPRPGVTVTSSSYRRPPVPSDIPMASE